VLIAADQPAARVGMRLALEQEADCSEAHDADEALEAAIRERPHVCLIGFNLAGYGIRVAARIRAKVPEASLVVLTSRPDPEELIAALRAGAIGYLPDRLDPARLPQVVEGIMRGEAAIPRALMPRVVEELRSRERGGRELNLYGRRPVHLTTREWQVLDLLRQGYSTQAIANLLAISTVTVRRHSSTGNHKLGVRTRTELVRLLAGNGL
jgi:DNA-binding NarL/FixJ family response regulator